MISVIIPTLNEAEIIRETIENLRDRQGDFEVIIADGGSTDGTQELLREFTIIKEISSSRGRGIQMNAGARAAEGDVLFFIHADSVLPPGAFRSIDQVLRDPGIVGGSFYLEFDDPGLFFKLLARFSRINHLLCTYGDQGLFLRAETFRALGGFREIPVMEDAELQRRLRRAGRFVKIPQPLVTSARRYHRRGPWRQHLQTSLIVMGYHLGVPPGFLARFYYGGHRGA